MKRTQPTANVFNRQRALKLDTAPLRDFLSRLIERLGLEEPLSVVLISDRAMRRYNRDFRGKDCPTDVLSFPWEEADRQEEPYLGDILISVQTADRQKQGTLLRELRVLSLHGVLHLIGYDHETDDGDMERFESELRRELGLA